MDEARAIDLCLKHRDPIGFEFLVRKYRREAYVHALALMGNNEDALDACQDAFAKAFASIAQLDRLPQFYPWFYCILRNRCFNLLARRQTAQRYQQSAPGEATAQSNEAAPRHILEEREDAAHVRDALAALAPEHREILTMKYIRDHSYDDIARLLGIPRGTVMSRLYHARLALRDTYLKTDAPSRAVTTVKTP